MILQQQKDSIIFALEASVTQYNSKLNAYDDIIKVVLFNKYLLLILF
jgi:hypothetical protein